MIGTLRKKKYYDWYIVKMMSIIIYSVVLSDESNVKVKLLQ